MSESPRTWGEALGYAQAQALAPSEDWTGFCQKFVRSCYGIPALFGSAWLQWLGADEEDKHRGDSPSEAPVGAVLCFKGAGPFGHIDLAARPFPNGTAAAWSNDLVTWGQIDKVARVAPTAAWGQGYLGYLTAVNGFDLQIKKQAPPKPKQDKRYRGVAQAVDRLERSLETAQKQGDTADAAVLRTEIRRLTRLYTDLRRS